MDGNLYFWMIEERFWKKRLPMAAEQKMIPLKMFWVVHTNLRSQIIPSTYMGASKNSGTPKWMAIMENPIKMDDLGYHLFLETSI